MVLSTVIPLQTTSTSTSSPAGLFFHLLVAASHPVRSIVAASAYGFLQFMRSPIKPSAPPSSCQSWVYHVQWSVAGPISKLPESVLRGFQVLVSLRTTLISKTALTCSKQVPLVITYHFVRRWRGFRVLTAWKQHWYRRDQCS